MIAELADAAEDGKTQVGRDAKTIILVGDPVIAGHAVHLVLGIAAHEDVVAAFADHFIKAAAADEDVVADDVVGEQRCEVVAGRAVLRAPLDPVVTLVAGGWQAGLGAVNEVVAGATEGGRHVLGGDNKILAGAAQDQIASARGLHVAGVNDVVAVAALDVVVTAHVLDDVIASAAEENVVAIAAFEAILAGVTIDGIVAFTGDDNVIAGSASEHDVVKTGVLQVVGVQSFVDTNGRRIVDGCGIVPDDQGHIFLTKDRDGAAGRIG